MSTILCIDDEPVILAELASMLEDQGFDVIQATNGKAGLSAILARSPDLVVCDVTMPTMNGFALVETLRSQHQSHANTPFIFLSALADQDNVSRAIGLGADDYLTKPVDFDCLIQKIQINLQRAERFIDSRARDLKYLAYHDSLTDLHNRYYFLEDGAAFLTELEARGSPGRLLLIDINGLKQINDFNGHDVGDQVIRAVAHKLRESKNSSRAIARIGGDEFAILTDGSYREDRIAKLIEPVRVEVDQSKETIEISVSVGVADFPRHGRSLRELMQNADLALYSAKSEVGSCFRVFDAQLRENFNQRVETLSSIRSALGKGQIIPYYQPLVDIETGRVEGLETLARWNHPDRGILTPAFFYHAFSDHALSAEIGRQMFEQVIADVQRWRRDGVAFGSVGLNVGESDLLQPGLVLKIAQAFADRIFYRGELSIEVTERCIFGASKVALLARLGELRALGCHIALDDFGTGYSSLTHLKELPRTAVKIDRQFVENIVTDTDDQCIVSVLTGAGKSIGFKVIAEGVETTEQRDLVRDLGCQQAQGYLYSAPVPASQIAEVIERLNGCANGLSVVSA